MAKSHKNIQLPFLNATNEHHMPKRMVVPNVGSL